MPQSHYHWNDREHDVTIGFELCMNIKNLVGYVANFLAARWVRSCAWYPSRTAQFIIFVMVGLRDVRHTVGVEDVGMETWPEGDNHLVALIWRIFFAFRFIHWACSFVLCLFHLPCAQKRCRLACKIGSWQKKINHYLGPWVPPCSAIVFKWKCGHRQTWTSYHNGTVHNWWSLCCHAILFFVRQLVLICLVCDNHSKRTTLKSNFCNEWFRHQPCLCPPTTSAYLQNCGFDVAAGC